MKELIQQASNYLGILPTTFVTISVSILVFALGILINQLIQKSQAYNERKIHRKLAQLNLKLLLVEVFRQSRSFDKFSTQLNIEKKGAFVYTFQVIPALTVFKEIGYKNLFKAYLSGFENFRIFNRGKRIQAFNFLWKNIEYVSNTHPNAIVRGENVVEKIQDLNELRNKSIGKVQNIVEDFRIYFHRQLGSKEPLGIFYNEREKIIERYIKKEDRTLAHHTNAYIQELLELNRNSVDLIRRYEKDIRSVELNTLLLESLLRFENMQNYYEASRHYFEHLSSEYTKTYKSLIRVYRILNSSPERTRVREVFRKRFIIRSLKNKLISLS